MKSNPFFRLAAVVAVVLCALAADGRRALASPETSPSVTGQWRGLYGSTEGQGISPVLLDIDAQNHRRFTGTLAVGDDVFEIGGTVAGSGNVHIVGRGEDGRVVGHLDFHDLGGGAALLDGELSLHGEHGARDRGQVLLLRGFAPTPGENPPDISGFYDGTSASAVTGETTEMTATFQQGEAKGDPSFSGTVNIISMNYTGVGTINSAGEFVFVGLGPDGSVRLEGTLDIDNQQQTALEGNYRLEVVRMNIIEDFGTFSVIRMN